MNNISIVITHISNFHKSIVFLEYFHMNPVQYNECLISIVDTDGLVLQHQGISSHSADYTPMCFPEFKG